MTKGQEDKLSMFIIVYEWLEKNKVPLAVIPIIATHQIKLKDFIDKINKEAERQAKETTGATTTKDDLKDEVAELTAQGAAALAGYFNEINDSESESNFEKITYSLVYKKRDTQVATVVNPVIETLDANIAALANHGFLPADLTSLKDNLTSYVGKIGSPRGITLDTSEATDTMGILFSDATTFFKKNLDRAARQLQRKNAGVFNQYQSARIIISTGSRSATPKATQPTPAP